MSNVVKAGGGLARTPTMEQLAEFVDKPLRQLPADWRAPVWDFWCFWSHLLPTQLPLVTRLRQWRVSGMTQEQMLDAFDRLNRPDRAGQFRFAGDLLAALADEVAAKTSQETREERVARIVAMEAAEKSRKHTEAG